MAPTKDSEKLDPTALANIINRKYGAGTLRPASDPHFRIKRLPTGILSVDYLLGGGMPRGRHVEIFGSYSVGKSFLTYRTIASAQRLGMNCAFVDVERTFDPAFAHMAGVDLDKLIMHEQEYGQHAINLIETLLRGGEFGVIALDSIAALLPKQEKEADMDKGSMGLYQAKLMSEALRRLTAANRSTVLIYINQLRDNVGVMFGKRDITSGGRAMSFYAGIRLELSRTEVIKVEREVVDPKTGDTIKKSEPKGHRVLVKVDKAKEGTRTGDSVSFIFDYELGGIDPIEDLIHMGRVTKAVRKKGNSWWIEGQKPHASKALFRKWLASNEKSQEKLAELIMKDRVIS